MYITIGKGLLDRMKDVSFIEANDITIDNFLECLGINIGCAIANIEAPQVTDTVLICCMGLLGIDSVTGIWRK